MAEQDTNFATDVRINFKIAISMIFTFFYNSFGVSEVQSFINLVNREEILVLTCTSLS